MTYKIFERKDVVTKKGVPLIFILQPGHKPVQLGIHCQPGSWDQVKQIVIVKRDPKAAVINIALKKASVKLQDMIDKKFTIQQIRDAFKIKKEQQKVERTVIVNVERYEALTKAGKQFYNLIESIIKSHQSDWSKGYKKRFRTICTKILNYEPNFTIEELNEEWWRGFVTYCIEELDNVSNTINTDAKVIAALMQELNIPGHDKISWAYIEPEVLGLSWDKVLKLDDPELIKKVIEAGSTLNDSRKLWLAGAFTGRRWEEISNTGPSNFYQKAGQWRYKNIGKGQKIVDIPLLPEAVEFFKKINFRLPRMANQVVNRDIKTICRIAGFKDPILVITPKSASDSEKTVEEEWETVHVHTGRHSYCQHVAELFAGKPNGEKTISWLMGHASFQTTWKYLNKVASSNEALFEEVFKES